MGAPLDRLQWLALLVWLTVLLLFLSSLTALFFSSRSARIHFRITWFRHRVSTRATVRPLLLTAVVAIVAGLLLQISAGETWTMRLSLVLVGAGVSFVSFDWSWKQTSLWIASRSEQAREWKLLAEAARRQLQSLYEPDALQYKACQLIKERLEVSHVGLWMLKGGVYRRVESTPQQVSGEAEFAADSLLQQELTSGWTFQSLKLADARNGKRLTWSRMVEGDLQGEQEQLAAVSAQVAVPLQNQLKLEGFFLLGGREAAAPFRLHHLEFAEAVAGQLVDCLLMATALKTALERVTEQASEQANEQAARRNARTTRTHLAPPQRTNIPGTDYGADYWLGAQPAGVYYDIIALPKRMAAFLLAEIPGPVEDSAVRLVQLQALLRSRAWAYNEDLAELVESTARGLSLSLINRPPISLFCARPSPGGRRVQYLNAGHFPAILLRRTADGAEVTRLHVGGPAIGESADTPYQVGEIDLEPGDLIAIASQGIVDARSPEGEPWGEGRLVESLLGWESGPVKELVQQALIAVDAFTGKDPAQPARFLIALRPSNEVANLNP